MKFSINLIKCLLVLLLPAATLSSCSVEHEMDVENNKQFTLTLNVPANTRATKALSEDDEYEVKRADVLVFDNSQDGTGKFLYYAYGKNKIEDISSGSDRKIRFNVDLQIDPLIERYDIMILTNCREAIQSAGLTAGMTREQVQKAITVSVAATQGWISKTSTTGYKAMPMWGEMKYQKISVEENYNVSVMRMVAKIDLSVALDAVKHDPADTFVIGDVKLYNYHTKGYVIPADGTLGVNAQGKIKVTTPTPHAASKVTGATNKIDYTSMLSSGKLEREIYTFEAPAGSTSDHENNICLVFKGTLTPKGGVAQTGWYRLDFANKADDLTAEYLSIKRNHHYNVVITLISGNGYETEEEAYESKPGNVNSSILEWEDGEFTGGVWNSNYEIRFSNIDLHFSQFGEPSPQVIKILTNVPELKFGNFRNNSIGQNDTAWSESPAGTWSNNHFKAVIAKVSDDGTFREYTVTVTAKPAISGDIGRKATFSINGKNLNATSTITQSPYVDFKLETQRNVDNVIRLGAARARVYFFVTSTHPYEIDLQSNPMFTGVFTQAVGGTAIADLTDIAETTKDIWIEVDAFVGSRLGELKFKHKTTLSTAPHLIYAIAQLTPVITAELTTGGYTANVPKSGGSKQIRVESNMVKWIPVLTINGTAATNAELTQYLGIVEGAYNSTVTMTMGTNPNNVNRVFNLTFKDANGNTTSSPAIVITQKVAGPGGSGDRITWDAVNREYVITNDATDAGLYFKYGSVVGMYSGLSGNQTLPGDNVTAFAASSVPFNISNVNIGAIYANVPYTDGLVTIDDTYQTVANVKAGKGDPCRLVGIDLVALKAKLDANTATLDDIDNKTWRLPTMEQNKLFSGQISDVMYNQHWWTAETSPFSGVAGGEFKDRTASGDVSNFLPAAGCRFYNTGTIAHQGLAGYYWSSTPITTLNNYCLYFSSGYVHPKTNSYPKSGFSVRCVSQ